jgi:TonB-linked SusC/RagA family outer membrane protein
MNRLYTYCITTFLVICSTVCVFAQQTIRGKVLEEESEIGIASVSIIEGKKTIGATNSRGEFTVRAMVGNTLRFRIQGYTEKSVVIKNDTDVIEIKLAESRNYMEEAVVIGYEKRTREENTGSSVILTAKDIQDVPVANVMELLQGRVPGLNIQNNTGSPGMRGTVTIRGISNMNISGQGDNAFLTPTSPLFVVDGIPIDESSDYSYGFETSGPGINPISLIPTEDIETIEVLKDAQATSLYGSRGAYGVILITTKRGKSKVPIVQYTGNYFLSNPPTLRPTIGGKEERLMRIRQILQNDTSYYNALASINSTYFLSDSLNAYYNNSTNWQSFFYRQTFNQTHNVNFSGGDQLFNYKVNTGYYGENGIVKNTGFTRFSLNMNMQYMPNNKFKLYSAINSSLGKNSKGGGNALTQSGVASGANTSSLLPSPTLYTASNGLLSSLETDNDNQTTNVSTNLELQYEPITGLRGTTTFNYTFASGVEDNFKPSALNNNISQVYRYNDQKNTLYNRNMLSYTKVWNDTHTFNVFGFSELNMNTFRADVINHQGTANDYIEGPFGYDWYNSNGGTLNNLSDFRSVAFAVSGSYNYNKKYVFDANYRWDGSSTNGPKTPYRKNPSLGVRWNFQREAWFDDASWLDYGSLRLTWGRNIVPTGTIYDAYGKYVNGPIYNTKPSVRLDLANIPNVELVPSTNTQWNFGFDLGILNGKFSLVYDTYYKQSDNLLRSKNIANHNAFGSISTNETSLVNYGHELAITFRPLPKSSKLTWTVSANGALNRDIMAALPDGVRQLMYVDNSAARQSILYRLGRNSLSNVLLHSKGVFSTDADVPVDPLTGLRYRAGNSTIEGAYYKAGDLYFTDLNGDYILDGNDYVVVGNSQPSVTGGISTFLQYNGWSLNVNTSFTLRRDILNNALAQRFQNFANPYEMGALVPIDEMDFWTGVGDVATYPNPFDYTRYNLYTPYRYDQTLFQEDGSYFKINQVTLSYNINRDFSKRYGITSVRIYSTVANVYTFSNYSGPDPEIVTALGRDSSNGYPNKRNFTLGLQIQF